MRHGLLSGENLAVRGCFDVFAVVAENLSRSAKTAGEARIVIAQFHSQVQSQSVSHPEKWKSGSHVFARAPAAMLVVNLIVKMSK